MDRFGFQKMVGLLVIAGLAACGSRSQLLAPPGESEGGGGAGGTGGTGGTTTATTTTTTTSEGGGGTGGLPDGPCEVLDYETPFSDLDGGIQSHLRSPKLAYSSADKLRVTVASAWQATEGPGPNLPIELRHTSFEPWFDFPAGSGFGPTYLADLDAGVSFAIAEAPGDLFAMLFRDFQQSPPGGLRFSDGFKPKSGDVPASILVDAQAQDAMFLAHDGKEWLYGAQELKGGNYETRLGLTTGDAAGTSVAIGCTFERAFADAVPIAGGFLAAIAATGGVDGGCDAGMPGPASGPLVARFQGGVLAEVSSFGFGAISDLQAAKRADGAWLVWFDPGGEDQPDSLVIMAVDGFGDPVIEPYSISTLCEQGSLEATSFEDFLAVACIQPEPEGASPHVQVFDPDGVARGEIKVAATGAAKGRVSILGSPISRSAVLAWSETAGIGDQIRITRVDCLDKN